MSRIARAVGLLALAVALATAATAAAAPARHAGKARAHHRAHGGVTYVFRGRLTADAGANATSISVNVTGGNRPALKAIIGSPQPTTFAVNGGTTYIYWQGTTPTVVTSDHLRAGDPVQVFVQGFAREPLAQILQTAARRVGDFFVATRPHGRLYLFAGETDAVDTTNHTITIDVGWGNWRALFAMLGQPITETFHYDSSTTFLHWDHGPHLIQPNQIQAGDPLTIRVIAPWHTPMSTLTQVPAFRVNDHDPMVLSDATLPSQNS